MAKHTQIDPDLLPEARMNRMRHEMWVLRRTVLRLVQEPYRDLIDPPYSFSRDESNQWERDVVTKVIRMVQAETDRCPCPLCGAVLQSGGGFSVPTGLERHLLGSHSGSRCGVMHAAVGLLRVRHRELYPGDFGPYGCD